MGPPGLIAESFWRDERLALPQPFDCLPEAAHVLGRTRCSRRLSGVVSFAQR
jgi:hypothetical protein